MIKSYNVSSKQLYRTRPVDLRQDQSGNHQQIDAKQPAFYSRFDKSIYWDYLNDIRFQKSEA